MTKIDELMHLAYRLAMAPAGQESTRAEELKKALEAALKQDDDDEPYECPVCGELNPCTSCGMPNCGLIAPSIQAPPPRLTDKSLEELAATDAFLLYVTQYEFDKIARTVESAVRKQAGWE